MSHSDKDYAVVTVKEEVTENLGRASKGRLCWGVPMPSSGTEAPPQ